MLAAVLGLSPIALLAGVVTLTCVAYSVWRVDPAYTLSLAIVLSPLAGNWQQLGIPGVLAPDRLLLTAGIAQVLLRAPAIRDRPPVRLVPAHALLALAIIYAVCSAFFAHTLSSRHSLLEIIDSFGILPFLTFLAAPLAFRTKRQRAVLLVALVALGGYLGLTVLFETVHLDALVFPKYILNPNYGIHVGRGRGPFVDAVANGFGLFVCAVACGVAIATWSRLRARLIAALVGVLCIVGVLLSVERSVCIGALVGSMVAMLATRQLRRYLLPAAAVAVIAIAAAVVLIPGLSQRISTRYNQVGTVWDRENLIVAAVNMIKARPLTGFGWGRFQDFSEDYFRQSQNIPLTATSIDIHNFVLLYAVELGLPGVTLWAFGLLAGVGTALLTRGPPDHARWRVGLLAIALMFVVVSDSTPPTLFPNLSLWLWAGVVFGGRYASSDSSAEELGSQAPSLGAADGVLARSA
jgi:putative inorganic carbon (hco3(-)) transporter